MLEVNTRLAHSHQPATDSISLDYDTRQKARIKTTTDSGLPLAIFLERGKPLQIGERLVTECGKQLDVKGALEPVMTAVAQDWLTFSRVCYHLGNRHTQLQIGQLWLRFKPDHVLEKLVMYYGLEVSHQPAVFEPESGAYGAFSGHSHEHGHHAHSH